ncbi:MAG TPA: putative sugar O-methyltransferase [Burkholderiales bacterium]|nr:putative sugar O-methyltransferase [Burkholderiales bacterium]
MRLIRRAGRAANRMLRGFGYQVIASAGRRDASGFAPAPLPGGAEEYLRPDNPRLAELERAYAACDPRVTAPLLWRPGHVTPYDLRYFRGDNAYVWQVRDGLGELNYALTAYYVRSIDALGLLGRLEEDALFGAHLFEAAGRQVSRDLLDSVLEIHFLERHLGLASRPGLNVLDIGAGYGRLAHRMARALPSLGSYLCVDAVAASTFLCEYYLRFRGVDDKARAVPLDRIEEALSGRRIDLALNIHSFPECTVEAIGWWLDLLRRHRVPQLMLVPNPAEHSGEKLITNSGAPIEPLLAGRGYRLAAKAPKYGDPVVRRHGVQPTWHYLFQAE